MLSGLSPLISQFDEEGGFVMTEAAFVKLHDGAAWRAQIGLPTDSEHGIQ